MYTRRHGRHTPEESLPGNVAEVNITVFSSLIDHRKKQMLEQDENFRNMRGGSTLVVRSPPAERLEFPKSQVSNLSKTSTMKGILMVAR